MGLKEPKFLSLYIGGMDTANRYLTEIDVALATLSTSTVSCHDVKGRLRKIVHKYKHNSDEIVDATRRVWSCIDRDSRQDTDVVSTEGLRKEIAGIQCKDGKVFTRHVSDEIPRGFVIPRFHVRQTADSIDGWIRHPVHGWLVPVGKEASLYDGSAFSVRRLSPQTRNGMIFCGIVLCLIGLLLYLKRRRLAQLVAQYQSIDAQFIDAPPPTHLRIETQTMSPTYGGSVGITTMMPTTTDLVNDFKQIAGTSLASSTSKLYS